MTFHPAALRCTPPAIMMVKLTSVASSMTTEKDTRKLTVLHVWQKLCPYLRQSYSCGKE
jgi:hypothetical protein